MKLVPAGTGKRESLGGLYHTVPQLMKQINHFEQQHSTK